MAERNAMVESALPLFHTKAKAEAEAKASNARATQMNADDLLSEIDDLLGETA